ncbi:MAG TPA: hypothetical protein PLY72_11125, partial [Candidatus Obscuribacter sp.]|nr:hypothetical protein [Candidatus Obscuribacter sp.]
MLPETAHFRLKSEPLAASSASALGLSLLERKSGKESENILVQGKEALTGWLAHLEIDSKTVALTGAALV